MPIPRLRKPDPAAIAAHRRRRRATVIQDTPPPFDRDRLPQYWHPQRFGVRFPEDGYRDALHAITPNLEVVFSPVHERWLVWEKSPAVTHDLCRGWSLKLVWETPDKHYLPLDTRLFAALYARNMNLYGGAVAYFDALVAADLKERQAKKDATDGDSKTLRKEYLDYRKIKNIGSGNKFALHHDGSIIAARGEMNWRSDIENRRRPA